MAKVVHYVSRYSQETGKIRKKIGGMSIDLNQFRVVAACPPSTSVQMRGGILWKYPGAAGSSGSGFKVYNQSRDLATEHAAATTFVNANYYKGIIFCYTLVGNTFSVYGGASEFATAVEAETNIITIMDSDRPWQSNFPLVGIVLKNNGTTGAAGQILPIDVINRGRSYIWKDLRPPGNFVD